jgi:hypothetical protein
MRRVTVTAVLVAVALGGVQFGCGGGSTGGGVVNPTSIPPVVSAISPAAGSTAGSTVITITGQNFAAGATVSVAGVPATEVSVSGTTRLTAKTGPGSAGTGDVVVSVGGMSGKLSGGFTYAVPGPSANPPPVIKSLVARGSRKNEPAGYADLGETISIKAVVTDAETPADGLVFEWTATQGTMSGTGASITWKAPSDVAVPADVTVTLKVVERFVTNDTAVPEIKENSVVQTTEIAVHDAVKEVGDMATLFLENFSKSSVPVSVVMKDFLPECYGTDEERKDVEDNRDEFTITSWSVGPPSVTVDFGGTCSFRSRHGDACSNSDVRWESFKNGSGESGGVVGVDQVAAVYRDRKWWLCDSQFNGRPLTTSATSRAMLKLLTR